MASIIACNKPPDDFLETFVDPSFSGLNGSRDSHAWLYRSHPHTKARGLAQCEPHNLSSVLAVNACIMTGPNPVASLVVLSPSRPTTPTVVWGVLFGGKCARVFLLTDYV